jgi:hypothetical protein
MSFCTRPIVAAKSAVSAPVTAMTAIAAGDSRKTGERRAIEVHARGDHRGRVDERETGVGPAIASGSQT